ncbi:MAG: addiction module protein [Verrucomicrobiota bacterium]
MSATEILEQIRRLPAREQLEVAEQIWNELGGPENELTPEQVTELDRRAERALQHSELCRPLDFPAPAA